MHIHTENICIKGTVSQIIDIGPSFCFMKSRKIIMKTFLGDSPDRGEPTLFALAPLGAAIVTNLVLKPHAEACCFGLFYSIVAVASIC